MGSTSDILQNQSKDQWDRDEYNNSPTQIRISESNCKPFKIPDNDNRPDDSPNSVMSIESFDSVKRINKEDENEEINKISAKLQERINIMKQAKKDLESKSKEIGYLGTDIRSYNPSPIGKSAGELPVVNEQDEINHRKGMKHRRAHSSSSNQNATSKLEVQQAVAEYAQEQQNKEIQMLTTFKTQVGQLKELLKKEIATKFVLLERCKNLKGENDKLRDLIGKSNPFEPKAKKKDVSVQVSIGSSCMANDVHDRGSIGKYYKNMFVATGKEKENQASEEKPSMMKHNSEITIDDFFKQKSGPEIIPKFSDPSPPIMAKKKMLMKPSSLPRNRRRSRVDRNKSKPKKQNVFQNFGPGTTIIVIQRDGNDKESFSSKNLEELGGLDEEIAKIKANQKRGSAGLPQHKSEVRQQKHGTINSQSFLYTQEKNVGSKIPVIGEKPPLKDKSVSKNTRMTSK